MKLPFYRAALVLSLALAWAHAGLAHPLGNLSVNRQAAITVTQRHVEIHYLLDMAEIPSLNAAEEADANRDGETDSGEWRAYVTQWARALLAQLHLRLDDQPLQLRVDKTRWQLLPGAAGLKVLRMDAHVRAALPPTVGHAELAYDDHSDVAQLAWSEVYLAAGTGVERREANVPAHDRSKQLTVFSATGEVAFPKEVSARATLIWTPGAPVTLRPTPQPVAPDDAKIESRAVPLAATAEPAQAATPAAGPRRLSSYFWLGMHHIAVGWDHLAFLLGLLLTHPTWRGMVKVVTAFTVAHSLTLMLAAVGWIRPPGEWIEPAIALSVAYVGLTALRRDPGGAGVYLAFAFGLVHGFGFAGALQETLGTGFNDAQSWLAALLAFNLGIEAFQLAVVGVLLPMLIRLARHPWQAGARRAGGAFVMSAGLAWFFTRVA